MTRFILIFLNFNLSVSVPVHLLPAFIVVFGINLLTSNQCGTPMAVLGAAMVESSLVFYSGTWLIRHTDGFQMSDKFKVRSLFCFFLLSIDYCVTGSSVTAKKGMNKMQKKKYKFLIDNNHQSVIEKNMSNLTLTLPIVSNMNYFDSSLFFHCQLWRRTTYT